LHNLLLVVSETGLPKRRQFDGRPLFYACLKWNLQPAVSETPGKLHWSKSHESVQIAAGAPRYTGVERFKRTEPLQLAGQMEGVLCPGVSQQRFDVL
jgi:hypothetical protein